MAPGKRVKIRVGDATFRPQDEQPSTSTVESGEVSPERQQRPKRKAGDETYRPYRDNASTSSVESGKRSPGRPRKTSKPASCRAYKEPRVNSEESELQREIGIPVEPDLQIPGMGGADGNGSFPVLSITDRLRNIRDFLHVEDYDTHPRFKERLDDFDKFISNLASSKEMFDVRVYHDVKAMLSVARDRVLDQERDEAMKVTTYKVPSWSSTESSKPSDRDRVFSPNSTRRKSDETDATSHHSDERERGDPGRMVDDYGDGDCLEWAPHLLKQARENRRPLANQERFTRGKQPSTETIESETTNKRMKRTKWGIDDFVWPERRLLNGKSPSPLDEQEHSWDKEHERSSGVVELDEEEEIDRESDTGLVRSIPKLGSGSLIPPEIADFSANDEEPVASANRARAERRAPNPDERFYPGDPVFMFGETKYLQALQSRQIEKDLAPQDAETQTAIDRKPLMGMFARFQLPKIYEEPVAKKSRSASYCTVS